MKERPEVTRDGNPSSGEVEYVDLALTLFQGAGIAQWLERRTRD